MADKTSNIAASVRDRLKTAAREQGTTLNALLIRYGLERFLYRLGKSPHRDRYLLKGAMLFASWYGSAFRPTQDLDLSAPAPFEPERVEADIREICGLASEPDGLFFQPDSLRVSPIREANSYQGLRVKFVSLLRSIRISNQIDIGFGDAILPGPVDMDYPTLLDMPAARILAYPRETVVAEKLEAIVSLGLVNSRMKDFYDLWVMSNSFDFNGSSLREAVNATFGRRGTALPSDLPVGLSADFGADADREALWSAFLRRIQVADDLRFRNVLERLRTFLLPLLHEARDGETWTPEDGWS